MWQLFITFFSHVFSSIALFDVGAMQCTNVTDGACGIYPFTTEKNIKGHLPEVNWNIVIVHFRSLFHTRCSPLAQIFAQFGIFYDCPLEAK